MIIDIHAHCFPNEYLDYIEKKGAPIVNVARPMGASSDDKDLEARLALMDEAGVDMQILSIVPQVPYFANKEDSVIGARLINNLYAELVKKYPTRFKAFGIFPLPHINESLNEIKRCHDELGMVGVALTTTILEKSLVESDWLEPIFAELNRRKAVVFLHPAGCCTGEQTKLFGLTWIIGAPFEDTYGVLHLVLSGVTSRYPDIQFISPHLGGFLPMIMQRIDNLYSAWGSGNISGNPSELIKKFWFDTVSHYYTPALQNALAAFPDNHLLLGTDYPYANNEKYVKAVKYIEQAGLSSQVVKNILEKNAENLFGMKL